MVAGAILALTSATGLSNEATADLPGYRQRHGRVPHHDTARHEGSPLPGHCPQSILTADMAQTAEGRVSAEGDCATDAPSRRRRALTTPSDTTVRDSTGS